MINIINSQLIRRFVDEYSNTEEDSGKALKGIYAVYLFRRECEVAAGAAKMLAEAFDGLREMFLVNEIKLILNNDKH